VPRKWTFFSNHGLALLELARRPSSRIRELAGALRITERAAQSIVGDLVEAGYLRRVREGRRNRYEVNEDQPLRHPTTRAHRVGELLRALAVPVEQGVGACEALVLACSDPRIQPWLDRLLDHEGLEGRAEVVLWPGGAPALAGPGRDRLYEAMRQVIAARLPKRILLVSHPDCSIPDVPVVAGSTPLHSYRAGVRWSRRIVRETKARLGLEGEAWFIHGGHAARVRTTRARRGRHRKEGTEAASRVGQ
jgi:hypothetical protein